MSDQTNEAPAEIVAYKAFDAEMKCRGFAYQVGQTYQHTGEVSMCNAGFHAVTVPFDAWNYYAHSIQLARVRIGAPSAERREDSKVVGASITIEARLSLPEWIRAQVSAVVDLCRTAAGALTGKREEHAAATGDGGHAAATGDGGHAAATGYRGHAAATGDGGHAAATGRQSIAVAVGDGGVAQAGPDGWLVLASYTDGGNLREVRALKVGADGVEPGQSYRLNARGKVMKVDA